MKRRIFLGAAGALAASRLHAPAIAADTRSRTLRFAPQAGLSAIDPIWTTAAVVQNFGYTCFDTLYAIDSSAAPQPQMASGHEVSADGLRWTFKLRDGLKFHDNTPVRAVDCIASIKRWGARDTMGQLMTARVQEYVVVDDKTFALRLDKPFPLMLDALARPISQAAFIMPERIAATDPMKQMTEVVGSGPYRFLPDDFVAGAQAAYAKFDGYVPRSEAPSWLSGGKVAQFDRVEWRFIPDTATAAAALKTGEIDWWEQVQPDLVESMRKSAGVTIGRGDPTGYIGVMRFNHLNPPFNNVKLRQAVMHAVDQTQYMQSVAGDDDKAWRVCHSMFPCGTRYGVTPSPDPMGKPASMDELRAMVKASGYAGEKAVIINPSDFPTIAPFGQISAALLKDMGLNVELADTDWGTVLQRRASREPVDKGGWSIFHTWWNGISITSPATSALMRGQGATGWFGWYGDPKMETLVADWLNAPTEADQTRVAAAVQEEGFAGVPSVMLGQFNIRSAWRSDLSGIVEGPIPAPWGVHRGA